MRHWKQEAANNASAAADAKQRLEEAQEELEEFQISSRELEAELEAQLEQAETKVRELTSANQRLQMENESLAEKAQHVQSESNRQINSLAEDLSSISKTKEELMSYVRDLEQTNDALENSKRQTISTLEDFEQRLNQALERNAYLENELEEKDQLQATIQRLKDEARDIRLEMSLKTRSPSAASRESIREAPTGEEVPLGPQRGLETSVTTPVKAPIHMNNHLITNGLDRSQTHSPSLQHSTYSNIPQSPSLASPSLSSHPFGISHDGLTPTARITALNIVGDLLRKVGSLESKLASCRTTSIAGIDVTPKPRAATIGSDFSSASFHLHGRPRANAVSGLQHNPSENYV